MFKKIFALSSLLVALAFVAHTPNAEALSCAYPGTNADFIQNGGIIFHGEVESNTTTAVTSTGAQTREVTFSVERAWGNTRINSPFTVRDDIPAGSDANDIWGFRATFNVGQKYTVYAERSSGSYVADIGACARSSGGYQGLVSELGVGYVPNETVVDDDDSFTDSLLKQIQELLAMVARLQEQLQQQTGGSSVTDFASCAAKTGVVLESYPRQCVYNGRTYVEDVDTPIVPPTSYCPNLSANLWLGVRGEEVSALQQFLRNAGVYTYPEITGYFGPATQRAVELWQSQNGVISHGNPETTGYGVVGPATRAAISRVCGGTTPGPIACTLEYAPVCGQPHFECPDGAICQRPLPKTYGNSCSLKAAGAQYLYEGECREDRPTTPPDSCRIWNDGCNTCSRTTPGGPMACTLRACVWEGIPKCEAYFDDKPVTGTSPVIHAFTGPTVLGVRETGVWEIKASDPQNGSLSYKIDWGEKRFSSAFDSIAALAESGFVQNTTFSHSYSSAGTYTITITVRDNQGLQAKTTTTVRVGSGESAEGFSLQPTSGNAPLTVTATITLPPRSGFDLIEVCGPIVVGDISWGDGTSSRPTRLGCSSQRVVTVTHTYQNNGTYNVVFERNDDVRYTETVRVGGIIGPNSNFSASPLNGNAPLTVTFTAPGGFSCTDGPDYKIDYGDGTEEMTPMCSAGSHQMAHTYTGPGVYTATLYSIPSGFGPAPIDRTPQAVKSISIIVGGSSATTCLSGGVSYPAGTTKTCIERGNNGLQECIADAQFVCRAGDWQIESLPWGPTCVGGSTYGAGYYEQCDTPRDTLSVFEPSGGFYNIGDEIRVRWSSNVRNSNAAMYLALQDEATGKNFKTVKVDRGLGQATINTGDFCNFFFSDGIDGDCSSLRSNIVDGGVRYRVKAVIYTPANACFGFCAPGSVTQTQTIIESYSTPFTISL